MGILVLHLTGLSSLVVLSGLAALVSAYVPPMGMVRVAPVSRSSPKMDVSQMSASRAAFSRLLAGSAVALVTQGAFAADEASLAKEVAGESAEIAALDKSINAEGKIVLADEIKLNKLR